MAKNKNNELLLVITINSINTSNKREDAKTQSNKISNRLSLLLCVFAFI